MTTIHSYTNDQVLTDVYHEDLRGRRSGNPVDDPGPRRAATAVGLVSRSWPGAWTATRSGADHQRVDRRRCAHRCARPQCRGSDQIMKAAAVEGPLHEHPGLYRRAAWYRIDFNHNAHSAVFDAP